MRFLFLFSFIIGLSIVNYIGFEKDEIINRNPASESKVDHQKIVSKIIEACNTNKEVESASELCKPYIRAKKNINSNFKEYEKDIQETITPEVAALSGFLLKTIYEQKITLEYRTPVGSPSVSIINNQATFNWSLNREF